MKNILVPTDFSACASYAVDAALLFAEKFNAKVHFFSCLNIPANWLNYSEEKRNTYPESQQLVANTDQLLNQFRDKAVAKGVETETIITGGELIKTLEEQVIAIGADFVIMGSHGSSGKQEFFIGSNAQKAIRKLHIPLFIIKDPMEKLDFKEVIYTSSFNTNDKMSFLRFVDFIKQFQPERIHLLAINTYGWFSQPSVIMKKAMEDFKELAKGFTCETHFHRDFSVDSGVRNFANEIGANLIVISNHHRNPIKRIFQGSNVEALVNHADLPVLTIDFQEPEKAPAEDTLFTEEYNT